MKTLFFGRPKPGLLVMWGLAAWAQTQLTPGVNVLAATRSNYALVPRSSVQVAASPEVK